MGKSGGPKMNDLSAFASHILKEIVKQQEHNRIFLADVYEKLCSLHRLPKPIMRHTLIELNRAGLVTLVFHATEPYLKVKRRE